MNRKPLFLIIFIVLSGLFSFSCEESNKTFTDEENKIIDSLYRVKLKESKTKMDSICDSVYNAEFPVMVDSIKKIRKKEVLDLIAR
jgi:hypothetical protein